MSSESRRPSETGGDSTLALAHTAMVPSHALSDAPTLGAPAGEGPVGRAESSPLSKWSVELEKAGRYVVLGVLGSGGMGTVLKAFDRSLDRPVALKVLHRELDEEHTMRLLREAQAMAKLSHPNVVQVYEVAEVEDQTFVAMGLVDGQSLRKWMQQSPSPGWRQCVDVFIGAGAGLAAAHEQGLVHRDFKPDNVVIDDKGRPRVLDFGLARQAEPRDEPTGKRPRPQTETDILATTGGDSALGTPLTRAGAVMGTPGYMPLEQIKGGDTDARSDQFSYCVALYEALYRERPFEGATIAAQMVSIIDGELRPAPKGTGVPAALRKVLVRGLAVDAADRWPSMEALLGELRRMVAPRRRGWLGFGLFGGLGLVSLSIAYQAEVGQRCDGAADKLAGIWDDARIQQVQEAILGTRLAYAPDTWERVERRLSDYATAWAEKHTEVCEATSVRQEQSAEIMGLRMACLRGRRIALREAVGVLADADEDRVRTAVTLAAATKKADRT
ncbi:MAG: serine/threonine protein kinase, partial [Nannocystaceae bacterium]|nr:serine/threonine protein kinase [Nannocystaceae bacterium]